MCVLVVFILHYLNLKVIKLHYLNDEFVKLTENRTEDLSIFVDYCLMSSTFFTN